MIYVSVNNLLINLRNVFVITTFYMVKMGKNVFELLLFASTFLFVIERNLISEML